MFHATTTGLFILVLLGEQCQGSLWLSRPLEVLRRRTRHSEAPEISMRNLSPHWLNIQCSIPQSAVDFRVFVFCPALASPCYENCIPTQPCKGDEDSRTECLPDKTAANCTEEVQPDGRKVTSLWIDKRNPRLYGSWVCTNQGLKSSVVNVLNESERTHNPTDLNEKLDKNPSVITDGPKGTHITSASVQEETTGAPPLYAITTFLSQSPWIFCLIAVFIISVTVNIIFWCRWCLVCIFTARRRKYNEDQKTLGDMVCLPTEMGRPRSGLWENDVYPTSLADDFQEPYGYKGSSGKIHHFSTFGPNNFSFGQPQSHLGDDFTNTRFPQYFNTMQPSHVWRTQNNGTTFSPGAFSIDSGPTDPLKSDVGSLARTTSQIDEIPSQIPTSIAKILSPEAKDKQGLKRFVRVPMNPSPVYDDVASSSTTTLISRDPKKTSLQTEPHLPSVAEFDRL